MRQVCLRRRPSGALVLIFASTIHVLLCVFMIFVILLQPGKDAGMGSALGGGAATSAFGGRGAVTFLGKVTAVCAIAFFLTSLGLSFVGMGKSVGATRGTQTEPSKTDGAKTDGAKTDAAKADVPAEAKTDATKTEEPKKDA